jgi:multidrug transporter EmrE-like cation transporter
MTNDNRKVVRAPYHPIVIPVFSILFTFAAGGIVAGINWTRLLKPQRKYPTIFISIAGFIAFIIFYNNLPASLGMKAIYIKYAIFALVGFILYFLQRNDYYEWKEKSDMRR